MHRPKELENFRNISDLRPNLIKDTNILALAVSSKSGGVGATRHFFPHK